MGEKHRIRVAIRGVPKERQKIERRTPGSLEERRPINFADPAASRELAER